MLIPYTVPSVKHPFLNSNSNNGHYLDPLSFVALGSHLLKLRPPSKLVGPFLMTVPRDLKIGGLT